MSFTEETLSCVMWMLCRDLSAGDTLFFTDHLAFITTPYTHAYHDFWAFSFLVRGSSSHIWTGGFVGVGPFCVYANVLHRTETILTLKVRHLEKCMLFTRQAKVACSFYKKPKKVKAWVLVKPEFALDTKL